MKLAYTILYVEDVPATLAFYERAFGLSRRFLHESGQWGELDTGTTALSFCSLALLRDLGKTPGVPDRERPAFEIAFVVEDVAAALANAVAAGAEMVQEAQDMPWGQTTGYVRDINGFLVELCTAMTA